MAQAWHPPTPIPPFLVDLLANELVEVAKTYDVRVRDVIDAISQHYGEAWCTNDGHQPREPEPREAC